MSKHVKQELLDQFVDEKRDSVVFRPSGCEEFVRISDEGSERIG